MKGEGNQTFGTTNMVVGGFAVIVCLFVYLFLSSFTSWLWPKGRTLQKCTVDPASKTSRGPMHACPGGWQRKPYLLELVRRNLFLLLPPPPPYFFFSTPSFLLCLSFPPLYFSLSQRADFIAELHATAQL